MATSVQEVHFFGSQLVLWPAAGAKVPEGRLVKNEAGDIVGFIKADLLPNNVVAGVFPQPITDTELAQYAQDSRTALYCATAKVTWDGTRAVPSCVLAREVINGLEVGKFLTVYQWGGESSHVDTAALQAAEALLKSQLDHKWSEWDRASIIQTSIGQLTELRKEVYLLPVEGGPVLKLSRNDERFPEGEIPPVPGDWRSRFATSWWSGVHSGGYSVGPNCQWARVRYALEQANRPEFEAAVEGADLGPLVDFLSRHIKADEAWRRENIKNGTDWSGGSHDEPGRDQWEVLTKGTSHWGQTDPESLIYNIVIAQANGSQEEFLAAIRAWRHEDLRSEVFSQFEELQRRDRANFARSQAERIQALGFSAQDAWKIIKVAGATMSLPAAKWLTDLRVREWPALLHPLNRAAQRSTKGFAAKYVADVFKAEGLEPPPGSFHQMKKCLRAAQVLGFIAWEVEV